MVLLELKQGLAGAGRTHAVTFGVGELMALEEEILSVFEPGRIVKPDVYGGTFPRCVRPFWKWGGRSWRGYAEK